MDDAHITLDCNESIKVNFYEGRQGGSIFVWQESPHKVTVAIMIGEEQKASIAIYDSCSRIESAGL